MKTFLIRKMTVFNLINNYNSSIERFNFQQFKFKTLCRRSLQIPTYRHFVVLRD